jgi:hypothetical protein
MLSKSIPSKRPMASLASTTVFSDDSTRTGTGKYCSATRDAVVADGEVKCIDMESGDTDLARSPIAKYPPSALSGSVIMIRSACNRQSWRDATRLVCGGIRAVPENGDLDAERV